MRENKSVIARGLTEIIEELITKRLMGIRVIENFYLDRAVYICQKLQDYILRGNFFCIYGIHLKPH